MLEGDGGSLSKDHLDTVPPPDTTDDPIIGQIAPSNFRDESSI